MPAGRRRRAALEHDPRSGRFQRGKIGNRKHVGLGVDEQRIGFDRLRDGGDIGAVFGSTYT